MKTNFLFITSAAVLSLGLVACAAPYEKDHIDGAETEHSDGEMKMGEAEMKHGGGEDDHASFAFGAPGMASMASRTVNITMEDTAYSLKELMVKEGETVRFVIVNLDDVPHEFTLGPKEMQA